MPFDLVHTLAGAVAIAIGLACITFQSYARPKMQDGNLNAITGDFLRRQRRRRRIASGGLIAVGLSIFGGQWVRADVSPQRFVVYWSAVLIAAATIVVIALLDALATHSHFARIGRQHAIERATLAAEIRRRRTESSQSSGKDEES